MSAFSLRRFNGLKFSKIEGLCPTGRGFFFPKNSLGVVALEANRPLTGGFGLEVLLGKLVGMKDVAAGLNSCVLALNLLEVAEVGVRRELEPCELVTRARLTPGLLGVLWE